MHSLEEKQKAFEERSKNVEISSKKQEEEGKHVNKRLLQIETKTKTHTVKWAWNMKHCQEMEEWRGKRRLSS